MSSMESPEDSSREPGALNLLDLPVELLERVLYFSDPNTVYTAMFTCRRIKDVVISSKPVLARQIRLLPGPVSNIPSLTMTELLSTFRTRAVRSLCGASIFCNTVKYEVDLPSKISLKECVFGPGLSPFLLVAFRGQRELRMFMLGQDIEWEAKLEPNRPELVGDHVRVLEVAISDAHDALALYGSATGSFSMRSRHKINSLWETSRLKCLKLVTFHRCCTAMRGNFYSSAMQDTMDIVHPINYQPVGLAGSSFGYVAVSWQDDQDPALIMVTLYRRCVTSMKLTNYDPYPDVTTFDTTVHPTTGARLIFSMQFTRPTSRLLFYTPAFPLPKWSAKLQLPPSGNPIAIQDNLIPFRNTPTPEIGELNIDVPFYGGHFVRTENGRRLCTTRTLAAAMHPRTCESYILMPLNADDIICNHGDAPAVAWSGLWQVLAKLDGTLPGFRSSVGTVLAVSRQGTRIAIANWTSISVWVIQPKDLIMGKQYFPLVYPPGQIDERGIVHLDPIPLPSRGVVYRLKFSMDNHNRLYGVTDEGLVQWDMGAKARGRTRTRPLPTGKWEDEWVAEENEVDDFMSEEDYDAEFRM